MEKAKERDDYPLLVPNAYIEDEGGGGGGGGGEGGGEPVEEFAEDQEDGLCQLAREGAFQTKAQVLRSVSHWSAGNKKPEASIQRAWIQAIEDAQHYIYIGSRALGVWCDCLSFHTT